MWLEKLTTILTSCNETETLGASFLSSFFEREGEKIALKLNTLFSPPFFAVGLGWGRVWMSSFIQESFSVCFLPGPSLPAEIQVYNGKLVPLLVLLVGNCYEITVISPFS